MSDSVRTIDVVTADTMGVEFGDNISETNISATLPTFSVDEIATYLTEGYWAPDGPLSFDIAPGGTLTVDITGLTAAGQFLARAALEAWTMVSGINFTFTSLGSGADIEFTDDGTGLSAATGFSFSGNTLLGSNVNITTDWLAQFGTTLNSYSFMTYMHEIGHALGLGHGGDYNGNADYAEDGSGDNHYLNDSWQATIMSYFSQNENTAINASYAYLMTPMIADILAIQSLYGAVGLRESNTIYGENSTAGGYYDTALTANVAFTIIDTGGIDTIDFGSVTADQNVTLAAEGISDVNGLIGNMIIARGTVIENFVSGSGDDTILGNDAANNIIAGAGNDHIEGGDGADTLYGGGGNDVVYGGLEKDLMYGGDGNDTLYGNQRADRIYGGDGDDVIYTGNGHDKAFGGDGVDKIYGGNGNDVLSGNDGNDYLYGGNLRDILYGGNGNDKLKGGNGDDTLVGGAGRDRQYGGDGADIFVFETVSDSAVGASRDFIYDFEVGIDDLDLSGLGAGLSFIGTGGFSNTAGEVRYSINGSGQAIVAVDVDGDGIADTEIALDGVASLTVDDFIF